MSVMAACTLMLLVGTTLADPITTTEMPGTESPANGTIIVVPSVDASCTTTD